MPPLLLDPGQLPKRRTLHQCGAKECVSEFENGLTPQLGLYGKPKVNLNWFEQKFVRVDPIVFLNAINGITYLLLQEKPKASQLNYLKSLEFSGNYLLNFINDILEINRLESDKVVIEKINFNLSELTENIVISFKEFIHENNIKCHLNVDKSIDYNLKGDPTKLSQILINLLNNAKRCN